MTPRIQKAIDIFLDAINNGTLAKGACTACAVSHLAAHGMGMNTIVPIDEHDHSRLRKLLPFSFWARSFASTASGRQFTNEHLLDSSETIYCAEASGFSVGELMTIESAFEKSTGLHFLRYSEYTKAEIRADQIKGLAAVVKVMLTFDDCKDSVEEVFTSKAELIPV